MSKKQFWDKEDIYDELIAPLMTQIINICNEHTIPIVATFQYCNRKDDGPGYCSTAIIKDNADKHMKDVHRVVKANNDHVMLAETHVTNPDGSKVITINRV